MSPGDNGARGEGEIQLDDFHEHSVASSGRGRKRRVPAPKANPFWRFVFPLVLVGFALASFQLWRTGTRAVLNSTDGTVDYELCDLCDIEALRAGITALAERHGPATVLANNAARDDRHKWRDVTPEYWDERQATNIRHMFFAIQAVAPDMIAAGGGSTGASRLWTAS